MRYGNTLNGLKNILNISYNMDSTDALHKLNANSESNSHDPKQSKRRRWRQSLGSTCDRKTRVHVSTVIVNKPQVLTFVWEPSLSGILSRYTIEYR